MALKATKGTIEEVSTNGECRQFCAEVGQNGFMEDRSGTPGIVILNAEVPHYLNTELGVQVLAGQLGDNILTVGLGDLTDLDPGTLILVNQKVVLRVEGKATHYRQMFSPSDKRKKYLSEEALAVLDQRGGSTCSVVSGVGERVCDNQEIEILPAEELKGAA